MNYNKAFNQSTQGDGNDGNNDNAKQLEKPYVLYTDRTPVRSLTLIFNTGRQVTLYYQFLMAGDYNPEQSEVSLRYTTCTVVLKGINMHILFSAIMFHDVRTVTQISSRHVKLYDEKNSVVTEINIIE
jgi:hypothetical protein